MALCETTWRADTHGLGPVLHLDAPWLDACGLGLMVETVN